MRFKKKKKRKKKKKKCTSKASSKLLHGAIVVWSSSVHAEALHTRSRGGSRSNAGMQGVISAKPTEQGQLGHPRGPLPLQLGRAQLPQCTGQHMEVGDDMAITIPHKSSTIAFWGVDSAASTRSALIA